MDQNVHTPEIYDYRQYDRVWQRVAPALEPYPGMRRETGAQEQAEESSLTQAESGLPGAVRDPCCMGSAAAEMLAVLTGFIEEEWEERRYFLALSRQAPAWAGRRVREAGWMAEEHARRLMAVYYLITGECYRPAVSCERICFGRWCAVLRERYHMTACAGLNYARAAEGTTDPCLREVLQALSAEEYRQARELLAMLERSLRNG